MLERARFSEIKNLSVPKKNLSLSYVPREPPKLVCDLESRLGPTSYPIPKITKSFNI